MARTSLEHSKIILGAILPGRVDFLDKAISQLTAVHFQDAQYRSLFLLLERYLETTGAVLTKSAMLDILSSNNIDEGKKALYAETFDALAAATITEAEFRWSIEQLKELSAAKSTAEAITTGMEILNRGAKGPKGEDLFGHGDARTHVLTKFAEIDRELSMQDSPEGDSRQEAAEILADYNEVRKSTGINFGIPSMDAKIGGLQNGELDLVVGYSSSGKSLPNSALVLTPDGFKKMQSIQVGDRIIDPEIGEDSTVVGVYPQGVKDIYRITFNDGTSAESSLDHLWEVTYSKVCRMPSTNGKRGKQYRRQVKETLSLQRIIELMKYSASNPSLVNSFGLSEVDFSQVGNITVDPYTLGLLLGDGSFMSGITYSTADQQLLEALVLPGDVTAKWQGNYDYRLTNARGSVNPLVEQIKELGLYKKNSFTKFVPEAYKWTSAENRLAILQGLLDTDGWVERGCARFSSASEQLRDDVVWLARSLGAVVRTSKKSPSYFYKAEKKFGATAYSATITQLPAPCFRLARKQKLLRSDRREWNRVFKSVELVRQEEATCIKVSAKSELFVTDNFIPTHNTTLATIQLAWSAAIEQGKNVVILTSETLRPQVRRKLICRHSMLEMFGLEKGINSRDLKRGRGYLSATEEAAFGSIVEDYTRNPNYGKLVIVQVPRGATISTCEGKLMRYQREFQVDLAIIDYLALLKPDRRFTSRREELAATVQEAKQLATTFDDGRGIPVVSPWQTSRDSWKEAQQVGYYNSSALAETAEATSSSDVVITLLEPKENENRFADIKAQIVKNRDGEKSLGLDLVVDYATSFWSQSSTGSVQGGMDSLLMGGSAGLFGGM